MILDEVKSWMTFLGWTDGGEPGSRKMDKNEVIARHGDATWIEDVQECCDKAERARIVAEIERRANITSTMQEPTDGELK